MIFCGQCGLQLAPGTTQCPRCGATVEENNAPATELHPDDATIATHSLTMRNSPGPSQASPAQPLILRPGANNNEYGSQMAYDATSRMESANYGTQVPQNPHMGTAYPSNYPQPSGSTYPTQGHYPDFANRTSGIYGGGANMNTQRGFQQPYTQDSNKMRVTALVLVLLGILLLLIAIILFVLQRTNAIAGTTPTTTPTAITTTSTPSDIHSGQQTIQQYYDYINNRDYQGAYNLWKTPQESFTQFKNGFQHTKHDDVRFSNVTRQPDGSVKITVTVTATEELQQGRTQQSIYTGYYIISKQDDNSWKITNSHLEKQ